LQEKCIYENKKRQLGNNTKFKYGEEFIVVDWNTDLLDYDIKLCSKYCVSKYNYYDYTTDYSLCDECRQVLDNRIMHKYNKSNVELSKEIEELKKQLVAIKAEL